MISSELRTLNKRTCHTGAKDARIESRADIDASLNISSRSNMFKFIILPCFCVTLLARDFEK